MFANRIIALLALVGVSNAFLAQKSRPFAHRALFSTANADVDADIASDLEILNRAADTKQEDSAKVFEALTDLEKKMRQKAKEDPTVATTMLEQLNGDWRLVFTTGTVDTQKKMGKINYFPIKAVQSFATKQQPMLIENGIYFGEWPVLKFSGQMDFDLKKRRLEFDFSQVALFNAFNIPLKQGEAAQLGAKSGLGSEGNVENASRGRQAFFNWISADETIATARGGGGGLALWKRVTKEE